MQDCRRVQGNRFVVCLLFVVAPDIAAAQTATTRGSPVVDLQMTPNPGAPAAVVAGDPVTYSFRLANPGPSYGDGTTYSITVSVPLTNQQATCTPEPNGQFSPVCGPVQIQGGVVSGTLTTLYSDNAVTLEVTGLAPATGGAPLTVTASTAPPPGWQESDPSNNQTTITTTVPVMLQQYSVD